MPNYVKPKRSREEVETLVAHMPLIDVDPRVDTDYFKRVASKKLKMEYGLSGSEPDFLDQLGVQLVGQFIDGHGEQMPRSAYPTPVATQQVATTQQMATPAPLPAPKPLPPPVRPTVPKPQPPPIPLEEDADVEVEGQVDESFNAVTEEVAPEEVPEPKKVIKPDAKAPKPPVVLPELRMPDEIFKGPAWLQLLWNSYTRDHRWEYTFKNDTGTVYTEGDSKKGGLCCKVIFSYNPRRAEKTGATPYKGIGGKALPKFVADAIMPKVPSGEEAHHFTFFQKYLKEEAE